ncbi:hypothetical protein NYE67_18580 [Solibacillus sp. FSL W8-0474]|uniref:hypothetical protein n=1 Tax=Solibacillus sp. FSL W8-0474 TaxID=2975336 RepID=UPI0030F74A12
MRTSRVAATPSSIYRNSTRAMLSDTHFADAINSGMHDHFRDPREQLTKKKQKKKPQSRPKKLIHNKGHYIIKGMQYNANSAETLRRLLRYSERVTTLNNANCRIATYKTSI